MNLYDIELLKKCTIEMTYFIPLIYWNLHTENILDTGPHFQKSGMIMEGLIPPALMVNGNWSNSKICI